MKNGQLISDEFGLSFEVKEESADLAGYDCVEMNSKAVSKIAQMLKSSLGPCGMDKIIVDQDNKITMTNDGATILKEYVSKNKGCVMELLKQLSDAQESEIGDGTTSIIVFANALLRETLKLMKLGMHPVKISEGINNALTYVLDEMKTQFTTKLDKDINKKREMCMYAVKTALNSKIAKSFKDLNKVCVDALYSVADLERMDVDLEKINIKTIKGGVIDQTELLKGVLLEKEVVGEEKLLRVLKEKKEIKICLLACPFEPPKLKTKSKLLISTAEEYKKLSEYERETFIKMIDKVKSIGIDLVLCQWGFDDEATSMLIEQGLPAVRWVGGHELGHIAALTDAKIISRFDFLTEDCIGKAMIKISKVGTETQKFIYIRKENNVISTILIKSSNKFLSEEIERSVDDALCAARNVLVADEIVYGGGSLEINLYKRLNNYDDESGHILTLLGSEDHACFRAFSNALLEIPIALAENAGYENEYVEEILKDKSTKKHLGIGIKGTQNDMKTENVFESLRSKKKQYTMAVDFVCSILKIHQVIKN